VIEAFDPVVTLEEVKFLPDAAKSELFLFLKHAPTGDEARIALRRRMALQLSDYKEDGLCRNAMPFIEHYKEHLKGSILDVGCYTGFLYHHLGKPEGYVGIDIWQEAIDVAKEYAPEARFECKSVMDFDGYFDVVWVSQIDWVRSKTPQIPAMEKLRKLGKRTIFVNIQNQKDPLGSVEMSIDNLCSKMFVND